MGRAVAIVGAGMVTAVGLSAATSCAAIRCAISNFTESKFYDLGGERQLVAAVELERSWRGATKLGEMLWRALQDCIAADPHVSLRAAPWILCLSEPDRPGRPERLTEEVVAGIEARLGTRLPEGSCVMTDGRVGGGVALARAGELIHDQRHPACIVAGVDSYLTREVLARYERRGRLLTSRQSNGFIPGEAAAAVLVRDPAVVRPPRLVCLGTGLAVEQATVESEKPLRGDGLAAAFRGAFQASGRTMDDMGLRIADVNGEQYGFKEADLAVQRILRRHKEEFDIWHPADCVGEIGAAAGPCILGIALAAVRKGYAPAGGILCHLGCDDGRRVALVLAYE